MQIPFERNLHFHMIRNFQFRKFLSMNNNKNGTAEIIRLADWDTMKQDNRLSSELRELEDTKGYDGSI